MRVPGLLALWWREALCVFVSGALVCAAAILAWHIWQPPSLPGLLRAAGLGLAAGSIAWSLVGRLPGVRVPALAFGARHAGRKLGFAPLAAQLAACSALVLAAAGVAGDLWTKWPDLLYPGDVVRLDWALLGLGAAALVLLLWDAEARWVWAGAYVLLLGAEGTWLRWRSYPAPWMYIWVPVNELAGIVLISALVGWLCRWRRRLQLSLRIPERTSGWAAGWFSPVQAILAGAVGLHVLWVVTDFRFSHFGRGLPAVLFLGRKHATTAALMLLGAAIVMAWQQTDKGRRAWQYGAFALGLLFTSSIGLANLDATPGSASALMPWLHRCAILTLSSTMFTMLAAFGMRLVFSPQNDWLAAGRRVSGFTACLALAALGAALAQEIWAAKLRGEVAMEGWAVVIVAAALVVLGVACLVFALRADWDPLRLGERYRPAYVYAAEALGGLVGLHLWLTEPWLFRLGIFERWWMLWVMGAAFTGAGLAALFERRGLPVLAQPLARTALALPLLPALGCWFVEPGSGLLGLTGHTPLVWFVIALFYGLMAASHRSLWLAGAAILAGNMGLWVFWYRQQLSFVDHPQLWLIPPAVAMLAAELIDR